MPDLVATGGSARSTYGVQMTGGGQGSNGEERRSLAREVTAERNLFLIYRANSELAARERVLVTRDTQS